MDERALIERYESLVGRDDLLKARLLLASAPPALAREARRELDVMLKHTSTPDAEMRFVIGAESSGLDDVQYSADGISARARWLLHVIESHKPRSVLDFGCGHGQTTIQLAYALGLASHTPLPRLHGCSFATAALASGDGFARRYMVPVELFACKEPLMSDAPRGPYDLVAVLDVLEHTAFATPLLWQAVQRSALHVAVSVPGPHYPSGVVRGSPCAHVRRFDDRELYELIEPFADGEVDMGTVWTPHEQDHLVAVFRVKGAP